MTTLIKQRSFTQLTDRGPDTLIRDLRMVGCSADACYLGVEDPQHRTLVQDVEVIGCTVGLVHAGPAIFERVLVDGLRTKKPLFFWAAAFRNVTLRGRLGSINLRDTVHAIPKSEALERSMRAANDAFYADTDWALDITDAQFDDADLQGIPARLIRRNPTTQAAVTLEAARSGAWETASLDSLTRLFLDQLKRSERQDEVLVVPARHPRRVALLEDLRRLRDMGVAEPD